MSDDQHEQDQAPKPADVAPAPTAGDVVFYDVAAFGEHQPVVHAGIVVRAADGRVRVKDLGPAAESADFPAEHVRLSA